ncbi:hypothetical protein [Aurantibacillus circumpalustris]|uniref:hypothetical protein n=1 Tax=Aurantibacillus circumpalustris TaxID=3036359 RepID=UPI00295AFEBD|nr:hypothetical protein [Aurantibacillus circumpalustris]
MNKGEVLFEEKQYLGHNRLSIVIRTMLALFCFLGYYWSENPKPVQVSFFKIGSYPIQSISNSGLIFFIVGTSILILSAALTFVLHIKTKVYKGYMVLDGFWTSRIIKIDLSTITSIRKSRYKRNIFKRAVYNLHNNGIIRFYTSGEDFIELIDNTGFTYKIGSQKPQELYNVLKANQK